MRPGFPGKGGYRVAHLTHLADALTYLKISPVDLVLIGPDPAGSDLYDSIAEMSAAHPEVPVIALMSSPTNGRTPCRPTGRGPRGPAGR